jgi:hypothetical protein
MKHSLKYSLIVLVSLFSTGLVFAGDLPKPELTPGATNPDVTQENIRQTICVHGYTKTIRPPAYYTNRLKKSQLRQYGYDNTHPRDYEEDHLIALSLGGAPMDDRNLWPQPRNGEWSAKKKDDLEFVLYKMVCKNEISLKQAQNAIATNWIEAYKRYVPSHFYYKFKTTD